MKRSAICEMIEQADANGNGKISCDEFADMRLKRQRPIGGHKRTGRCQEKDQQKEKEISKGVLCKSFGSPATKHTVHVLAFMNHPWPLKLARVNVLY